MKRKSSKLTTVPLPLMEPSLRMAYIENQLLDYIEKLHCDSDELVSLANAMLAACAWADRHDEDRQRILKKKADEEVLRQLADEKERRKAAKDLRSYRSRTEAILDNVENIY